MPTLIDNGESGLSVRTSLNNWIGQKFNVRAFGAAGDGVTDDTDAINAANAAAQASGGLVYFPDGHYVISGGSTGFNATTNGILTFAVEYVYNGSPKAVKWVGETQGAASTPITGYRSGPLLDFRGAPAGSGTAPAAISTAPLEYPDFSGAGSFNNLNFYIEGLCLLLPANPTFGGVMASNTLRFNATRVSVFAEGVSTQPTHESFGIWTPQRLNNVFCTLDDTHCVGFMYGYVVGEHCKLLGAYAGLNVNNYKFTGIHVSWGLIRSEACHRHILVVDDDPQVSQVIVDLTMESETSSAPPWAVTSNTDAISDSGNILYGAIRFEVSNASSADIPYTGCENVQFRNLIGGKNGALTLFQRQLWMQQVGDGFLHLPGNIYNTAGASYDGSDWTARTATPTIFGSTNGGFQFYRDIGKSIGSTYAPTQVGQWDQSGITPPKWSADPTTNAVGAALSSADKGLVYFNTSTNKLKVYNGSAWETITSA